MKNEYARNAVICKVLSEPKRLRIVDMLSCGELCACKILEEFQVTQPTLSHDLKRLCEAGIVLSRREGKRIFYSLNGEAIQEFSCFINHLMTAKENCICKESKGEV